MHPRAPPRIETEHSRDAIIEKDQGGEDAETNRHVWGWMHNRRAGGRRGRRGRIVWIVWYGVCVHRHDDVLETLGKRSGAA
jgi:hypothetical protein